MDKDIKFMQSKGSAEDTSHENEVSKHGGKREGAGRPLGSKSKSLWKTMEDMASKYQHSPLDYLLSVLNNPASSPERKMYAAEKAAPYIHPKLANTTSKIGTDAPIEIKVQWQKES